MHQTRKGKQWYFGLKAHIGVDSKEGVIHSVCTSAASVADVPMLPDLLHGEERKVWGDGGYQGQTEVIRQAAPHAQDMTCRRTRFRNYVDEEARRKNTTKSRWRWWMYRRAKSHRLTGALGRRTCCGHGRWRDSIATRRLLPHAEIADKLLAMNALSVGAKKSSSEAHQMLLDIQSKLAVKQFN